jgi:hypothetical protein
MVKPWRCPHCRSRAGVPVQYGLPTLDAVAAAERGEVVLGGCVLGDDDPPRCCTACRAALWAGDVFAVPGAGDDRRVVVARTFGGRRLMASVTADLDLTIAWAGSRPPEAPFVVPFEQVDFIVASVCGSFLTDGSRLDRWLRRRRLEFVGSIEGRVDRLAVTSDGMVTFEGPGGELMVHTSVERFVLGVVASAYRWNGFKSIAELRGWLRARAIDFLRSLA